MWLLAQQQTATTTPAELAVPVLFYGLAALTVLSAWAVVISSNIVRMAVYLLLTLAGVAGLYFLLHAELLAAIQLIVYVGGTLILIVFGVMLTNRGPFHQMRPRGWEMAVGIGLGATVAVLVFAAMLASPLPASELAGEQDYNMIQAMGRGLMSLYVIPFEMAAVILLVVMVGAAYMARRRGGARGDG